MAPSKSTTAPPPLALKELDRNVKSALQIVQTVTGVVADENDSLALVALYNAADGLYWLDNTNWLIGPLESWYGVSVNANGRVDSLDLSANYLYASNKLPNELFKLTELISLDLSDSWMDIKLSPSFGSFPKLQNLNLSGCYFYGAIPSELYNLTSLKILNLSNNYELSATLSSQLANLVNLEKLHLSNAGISGALPKEIDGLAKLATADLSYNRITSLPKLTNINIYFDLRNNNLTFDDFENKSFSGIFLSVNPQKNLKDDTTIYISDTQSITLTATADGTEEAKTYQWYQDGFAIDGANSKQIELVPPSEGTLAGEYYCVIENNNVPSVLEFQLNSRKTFIEVFSPIKASDRLALEQIYKRIMGKIGAVNWTDKDGNFTEFTQLWEGVYYTDDRVTSLYIYYPINGKLSDALGDLDVMTSLNFYNNNISELPETLSKLTALESFTCSDNKLTSFPTMLSNISGLTLYLDHNQIANLPAPNELTSINSLYITNNNLDFEDLIPYDESEYITYYPQNPVSKGGFFRLENGDPFSTSITVGGDDNEYQWVKNGETMTDEITETLTIESVTNSAVYQCIITNEQMESMELVSGKYEVFVRKAPIKEILAPSIFYSYSDGGNQEPNEAGFAVSDIQHSYFEKLTTTIGSADWDIDPIQNLIYFKQEDDSQILSYNFKDGAIESVYNHQEESQFGLLRLDYYTQTLYFLQLEQDLNLKVMRLNLNSGASPETFISNISNISGDGDSDYYLTIDVHNRHLYWQEPSSTGDYSDVKRKNLDGSGDVELVLENKSINGEIFVDGKNKLLFYVDRNTQSSVKSIVEYDITNQAELIIFELNNDSDGVFTVSPNDEKILYTYQDVELGSILVSATYDGEIIESVELGVNFIESLKVFDTPDLLQTDKAALLDLLANTTGFTPDNWSENTALDNTWEGVTIADNRVTELNLSGTEAKHWQGEVSGSILNLTALTSLDLSNHGLTAFPDVSRLSNLASLNIKNNRLGFQHIVPNRFIEKFTYEPQKRYGEVRYDTLAVGESTWLEVDSMGAGTSYSWKFAPLAPGRAFNDDTLKTVGNTRKVKIEALNFDTQGTYRVVMTNANLKGMVIQGRNQNILAKTDVSGTISHAGSPYTDGGKVFIYRQTAKGPFIKEDSSTFSSNGKYVISDVVLGNFALQVKPNRQNNKNIIQTYFLSADTYKNADTLKLRDEVTDINVVLKDYIPKPTTEGATIKGQLFSEVEDEIEAQDGLRILARRKVRKAACSMRKFKSTGRSLQEVETELAYYIETDDEGYFNFTGVTPGKYLLNIEFPGVPMDPASEVEFEISEDKDNQVFDVLAIVGENGINIDQTEVLFSWKPYLKEINIYPNPTEGLVVMDYLVNRSIKDLKIKVLTITGKILHEQKMDHHLGKHATSVDLTEYEAGLYFLIFTNEAGTFKKEMKVIKL